MVNTNNLHFSFDLDGTLINSIPLMRYSWERTQERLGLQCSWSSYKKNVGLPFLDICKNLKVEDQYHSIKELYFRSNAENISKITPMPGLDVLIEKLKEFNASWSIITSKPRITALPILDKFGLTPDLLITSDDTEKGKPFNDPSKMLLKEIGNKTVFYTGDSIIDFLFSINSGFNFIQFSPKSIEEEFLVDSFEHILNPRIIVSSLSEVADIIAACDVNLKAFKKPVSKLFK